MKNNILGPTLPYTFCMASALVLTFAGCKNNKGDETSSEELKMTLKGPGREVLSFEPDASLQLAVIAGEALASKYKIRIRNHTSFDTNDWTGPETVKKENKTLWEYPADDTPLEKVLTLESLVLKKGYKESIPCRIKLGKDTNTKGKSCSADVSIVDDKEKLVAGPITLKWKKAYLVP